MPVVRRVLDKTERRAQRARIVEHKKLVASTRRFNRRWFIVASISLIVSHLGFYQNKFFIYPSDEEVQARFDKHQ